MPADPTEREARIDRLCGEYLTAAATGREPDRATWLAQHPDLADELAEFLDCLNEVGRRVAPLRAVAGGDTIDHHPRDADAVPPGAVSAPPGYEILEKIAEGGMEVVYRARAVELNRVVALKMIRAGDLAGAAVQRFRQEAEAAAGFDHPHIVPVYEVGVTDAGDPFFSMKLVEGR
ncbi:MAG TPA: hypothetical protein VMZ71_03550, partial [Gemmataceae bacterium]|nr:hypothetical protein [Gemmataceae bacterium]